MVNKIDTHEKLFKEWRERYNNSLKAYDFVEDGIIDPTRWEKSPCKILFILKESYHARGAKGDWDMRRGLLETHKGPFGQTFWKTAYLSYILLQLIQNKIPNFPDKKEVIEPFLSSAIINIKKPVGNKLSDINDLNEIARKDSDLIKRQIELIKPKIILCGGTWEVISENKIIENYKKVSRRVFKTRNLIIFHFWHPGVPAPAEVLQDTLCWIAMKSKVFGI